MKLELKHLAPYLPYRLKGIILYEDAPVEIIGASCLKILSVKIKWYDQTRDFRSIKPILRPLSDLMITNVFGDSAIRFIDESDNGGDFTIDDIYFKYQESSFSDWRNAYDTLLENHFDVFGLIEKGLAIDKNTIK